MKSLLYRYKDHIAACIIVLVALTFFWDTAIGQHVFFTGDNLSLNVPAKVLIANALRTHIFPLWNPYILSGIPFLADIGLGTFAPINILFLLASPLRALTLTIVIDIILAGLFMYLYLRVLGKRVAYALPGAVVFMLSGSVLQLSMNISILNVLVWIPLVMACVELTLKRKSVGWALLASVFLSVMTFSGHVQYLYYTLLLVTSYTLLHPGISFRRRMASLSTFFLPALFLTAVQTLPFLEFVRYTTRPARDLAYAGFAAPAVSLIRLVLPNAFGILKDGTSWGAMADINGYVGIIPLILILPILAKRRKSYPEIFYGIAALITLGIAIGRHSPVFLTAFYLVPLFSLFRSPQSILILYSFALAVLTAFGIEAAAETKKPLRLTLLSGASGLSLVAIAGFQLFCGFPTFRTLVQAAASHIRHPFVTRFLAYPVPRQETIYNLWVINLLVFFGLTLIGMYLLNLLNKKPFRSIALGLVHAVIIVDLFLFGKNMYVVTKENNLRQSHELAQLARETDTNQYRIVTYQDEGKKPVFGDASYFLDEARKTLAFDQVNANIYTGLHSIDGYSAIVHRDYYSYLTNRKSSVPTGVALPKPGNAILNNLGVRYVLTGGTYQQMLEKTPDYEPVLKYGRTDLQKVFTVYQNLKAMPRSYVLNRDGSTSPAKILGETMNTVDITVVASAGAKLMLSDLYYPGWQASVNGKQTEIERYQIFRCLSLPGGTSGVRFEYKPNLFVGGLIISGVNWLGMLFLLVFFFLKKQKEKVRQKLHPRKSKIKNNA